MLSNAEEKELKSCKDKNIFVIPYSNQKCISGRWVCSLKETSNSAEPKARIVARGFDKDTLTSFKKQSSTTSKDTLYALLSTTPSKE